MAHNSGVSLRLLGSMPLASPSSMFSVSPAAWRESTRANYFGTHCKIILKCTRNRALSNFGNNVLRPIKSLPTSLVDSTDHPKGKSYLTFLSWVNKVGSYNQHAFRIVSRLSLGISFPGFKNFCKKFMPIGASYFVRHSLLSLTITTTQRMWELTG
jgi:hypothetical protein